MTLILFRDIIEKNGKLIVLLEWQLKEKWTEECFRFLTFSMPRLYHVNSESDLLSEKGRKNVSVLIF